MFSNKIIYNIALVGMFASASVNAMQKQLITDNGITQKLQNINSITQNLQNINNTQHSINDEEQNINNINNTSFSGKDINDSNEKIIINNETNILENNENNNNTLKFPDVLNELNNFKNSQGLGEYKDQYNVQNILNEAQNTLFKIMQTNIDKEDKKYCETNIIDNNNKFSVDQEKSNKILNDIDELQKSNKININNNLNNINNDTINQAMFYVNTNLYDYTRDKVSDSYMKPCHLTLSGMQRLNIFDSCLKTITDYCKILKGQNNTNQRKIKQVNTKITELECTIAGFKRELAENNKKLDTILKILTNNGKEINNIQYNTYNMYKTIDNINQQIYDMNDTINCNYRNIETISKNLKVLNNKRNSNDSNINISEPKQGWQRSKFAHEKKPSDTNTNKEDNIDIKKENNKINITEYTKNINKDTKQEDKK